ncbi:hypothetical protein TIFTF001_021924 [Ficus carica]|uniref:Amino acid transporter transmembrane domain-containing protein n=1 Tax=Ficus carica TaxID=3494 RepID=A0AA88DJW4_FICCA|nr:hypothetical protein TIFTF001_021924 [Ficus carica]
MENGVLKGGAPPPKRPIPELYLPMNHHKLPLDDIDCVSSTTLPSRGSSRVGMGWRDSLLDSSGAGPGWGKFYVSPLQLSLCYSAVVAFTLLAWRAEPQGVLATNKPIARKQVCKSKGGSIFRPQHSPEVDFPVNIVDHIATILAAMLPFFGDLMALYGAFGCIPLDIILPMVFYNKTFKPSKYNVIFWGQYDDNNRCLIAGRDRSNSIRLQNNF